MLAARTQLGHSAARDGPSEKRDLYARSDDYKLSFLVARITRIIGEVCAFLLNPGYSRPLLLLDYDDYDDYSDSQAPIARFLALLSVRHTCALLFYTKNSFVSRKCDISGESPRPPDLAARRAQTDKMFLNPFKGPRETCDNTPAVEL